MSGEAARIARALGGRNSGGGWSARCPAHEDRSPSLSIGEGADGRLLLKCHAGCAFEAILEALRRDGVLGAGREGRGHSMPRAPRADPTFAADLARRRALAAEIFAASGPARGSLVERYLRARAIQPPPPDALRFHPSLRHPTGAIAPAMVAAILNRDGAIMGVHRTWLAPDGLGKATLTPSKAMLGSAKGGAVRLIETVGPLIVAEGIETALSLAAANPNARIWAALSASGVRYLRLPKNRGALVVAADGDPVGRRAGAALAERAAGAGWRVRMMPAPDGGDWNDVLREQAEAGDGPSTARA